MVKSAIIRDHGGPEVFSLENLDLPPPAAGELRVRNIAIGLNFIDIYQRTGLYPVSLPTVLGSEAAGIVEAAGAGVENFAPGDRIAYLSARTYAEAANVPAAMAAKIPDGISEDIVAAAFLKGLTAEMLARQVFAPKPGCVCLIYAAAGGVGTLLVQWAKHLGARVIAVVGSDEKAVLAKENGADDIIVRTKTDSIAAEVRKLTAGHGVDVVYDSVGAATFTASLDSLAMRGMMVTYGNASGPVPPVAPLELSRRGSLILTRPTLFHYATPDRLPEMAAALFDMIEKGALKPWVGHTFKLDDVAVAHRLLEGGKSTGAIVLKP